MRTTHTSKSRHEIFGPKCPDFDGNVVTKITIVHTDERSSERRGKRTTITTDARITGTLSGGFTDDFEYRGPLALDLDFVIETRVATVIAATGKVIDRKPTATRRVKMTASIAPQSLGALETAARGVQRDDDHRRRRLARPALARRLPRGPAARARRSWARSRWPGPRRRTGFAATVDNAAGFQCVVATADPASLTLAKGASGDFTVTERGLDDQRALPSSSNVRVFSGDLDLSPVGNKIHGPASGLAFRATSRGGASVAEV